MKPKTIRIEKHVSDNRITQNLKDRIREHNKHYKNFLKVIH